MQPWDGLPGSTGRPINYGDTLICWGLGLGVGVIRARSVRGAGAAQQNQGDLGKPEREGETPVSLRGGQPQPPAHPWARSGLAAEILAMPAVVLHPLGSAASRI